MLKCLDERKSKEDKFYSLNDSFETFFNKYPFMFLVKKELEKQVSNKTEFDKKLLYPYAKFPAEIIQDKLYLVTYFLFREVYTHQTVKGN